MKRRSDWRSRLVAVVDAAMREPIVWGQRDCALFMGDIVEAIIGTNPAASFRGTYSTRDDGFAALNAAGYADIADFVSKHFEEIHPSQARRGDIAIVREGDIALAGFFEKERIGALALTGYATVPRARAERAFKVGD